MISMAILGAFGFTFLFAIYEEQRNKPGIYDYSDEPHPGDILYFNSDNPYQAPRYND